MNHQETMLVYEWLAATYPRNYRGLSEAEQAIRLDNLLYTFRKSKYEDVINMYHRAMTMQKSEPHASEILAMVTAKAGPIERGKDGLDPYEVYEKLKGEREYAQLERIYGESLVRRTAKICTQFGTMAELKWRLMNEA